MEIGIKELKKSLSKTIDEIDKNKIIVVTKSNRAVATLISIKKTISLAGKSKDKDLLDTLDEVFHTKVEDTPKIKENTLALIDNLIRMTDNVPTLQKTIDTLNTIKLTINNLVTEANTKTDRALLFSLRKKTIDTLGVIIESDYYNSSQSFSKVATNTLGWLQSQHSKNQSEEIKKDIESFIDYSTRVKIDKKLKGVKTVKEISQVITKITKKDKTQFAKIFLITPKEYSSDNKHINTLYAYEGIGKELVGKKVGDTAIFNEEIYEILAIG